ncbi:hypothetical protein ERHA55_28970 [Erwinia rhapontici]|nr:hypothetical protein ERHA55_28970 [Erwinia rhapontici]
MNRGWKIALAVLMAVILLLTGILLTVTQWLPRLAGLWLPAKTSVVLDGNPAGIRARYACRVCIIGWETASWRA